MTTAPAPRPTEPLPLPMRDTDPSRQVLGALAAAIYTCDAQGRVTFFNDAAAELWGRRPVIGKDLWCGSWKIYNPDGSPLPLDSCPMAVALTEGRSVRGVEIVVERPDGVRRNVLPHPDPIRDASGQVIGAVNMLVDITHHQEAERAQALLAAIVDSSDDAIISKSLDGRITSWNKGAQHIFGYTAQEIIGRSITTLIPDDRLTEEQTILAKLRRRERIEHYETVRLTKDGRLIDVSLTVSPVLDSADRLIGASKVARDVTEHKRAQRTLAQNERTLADFFENAALGLHLVDSRGVILRANKAELAMLGYDASEYIGRHISDVHVDPPVIDDMLARLHRGEDLIEFPARVRRKDGAIRHVRVSSNVLREDGRVVHTRCFTRDVTEQVLAQEALAESESRLRTLLSLLPVGVYSCDTDGHITFFNRRAQELWGRLPDPDDTRFCAAYKVYRPDGTPIPPDQLPITLAARDGKSYRNTEAIFERSDGSRFHASVNIDPVRDEQGRIRGAINVFQDISVQVAAREALEFQQKLLEDAVVERTRELEESHQRLRRSERMASLGTLSAGIGHDLGNLLLPVRVSLDVLTSSMLPDDLAGEVARIRTSVEYLQQLANGLRMMTLDPDLAQQTDPLHVSVWWSDAAPVVKNALPPGTTLESHVADDAWIRISRPALTQIVFNLAQNAGDVLRGRADGRVRISVQRDGDLVRLRVEDNGPGMTGDVLSRCMEPFFTTKTRGISTGLGLVLVAGLVREAGGTVQIRSQPGRGATFDIAFPATIPPPANADSATPRGYATITLRDPRLRAIVAIELQQLAFEVLPEAGDHEVHIAVTDDLPSSPANDANARHHTILFADPDSNADDYPPTVHPVGSSPTPLTIRAALHTAAQSLPTAAPAPH